MRTVMSFEVHSVSHKTHPHIAVLTVDNPPVNAMSPGVPGRIIARLNEASTDDGVRAILLTAGGGGGWAGADIKMQGKPWPAGEPRLTDVIAALEASTKPVAILIRRHALGGGLEMAMACHLRLATPDARVGQPEVKLGIPPGAGGTQRLPRLVGVEKALDLILSGDPISAATARGLGLIDDLLANDKPQDQAAGWLAEQIAGGRKIIPVRDRAINQFDPDVFEAARSRIAKRMRGQRAPEACVDCVEAATRLTFDEGIAFERQQFEKCVTSDQAAALRHVFFAETQAKKLPGFASAPVPGPIEHAAVIGAGTMGTGIAMCLANAAIPVTLIERDQPALKRGLERITATYEDQIKRKRVSSGEAARRRALVTGGLVFDDIGDADLVIEAVYENMAIKKDVFAKLANVAKPGAVLATNTSYLDVDEIALATSRAPDVLGMHFFSPANIMPLMEIVRGRETSDTALATAFDLGRRCGKTSIVSGVCHGFIANRTFALYLREAEFLLEEGASPAQVDRALYAFGMPMGPFAVRDLAGGDIGWAKRKATAHLRDPKQRYSHVSDRICERGWFGQKTGRGYYRYEEGGRTPIPDPEVDEIIAQCAAEAGIARRDISDEEIIERCLYIVINEAARELEEGIAARASDIDLAWITGYGFPRWRGGILHWADTLGLDNVLARIREFDSAHDFWSPAPLLNALVGEGQSFAQWDREKKSA